MLIMKTAITPARVWAHLISTTGIIQPKKSKNSQSRLRFFFLALFLFSFALSLCLVSSTANAQTYGFKRVESPTQASIASIDMLSSYEGWAVGSGGAIIHWDGKSWKNVSSPTSLSLVSVDMVSSSEGYAIALNEVSPSTESVIQWDGTKWSEVTTPQGYFNSVDIVNSTDGWAVGNGGVIIRWNGTGWNRIENEMTYQTQFPDVVVNETLRFPLESVDMISATEGWAVGHRAVIIRWNGTNWSRENGPEFMGNKWLWSVDMVSSTEGWAVGSGGDIRRWDGASWKFFESQAWGHMFSVDMISSTDGWAVGSDGCVIRWNGTSWNKITSPTSSWLSAIDMVSPTDGWIAATDGNIYRWQQVTPFDPMAYPTIIAALLLVMAVWLFIERQTNKLAQPE